MKTKFLFVLLFFGILYQVYSQVTAFQDVTIICGQKFQLDLTTETYIEITGSNWTSTVNLSIYDSTEIVKVYSIGDINFSKYPDNIFKDTLFLSKGKYTAQYDDWRPEITSLVITPKQGTPSSNNGGSFIVDQSIDTANYSFNWYPNKFINDTSVYNPIVNPNETMDYIVKLTEQGGAISYDTVRIYVEPFTIDAGKDQSTNCWDTLTLSPNNKNVTVYIKSPEVSWSISEKNSGKKVLEGNGSVNSQYFFQPNVYKLKIINNGPSTFDYSVKPSIGQGTGLNSNVSIGDGDSIVAYFNVTDIGLQLSWNPTGIDLDTNNYSIKVLPKANTDYVLIGKTENGCMSSDTVRVAIKSLTVNAGLDKNIDLGTSVQLDVPKTNYKGTETLIYSWSPSYGLDDSTAIQPMVKITDDTQYELIVSTLNGCTATDSLQVIVNTTSIDNQKMNSYFQIYPNPVSGIINLRNVNLENSIISIGDIQGKIMPVKRINSKQIDVSNLSKGIYYLKIISSDNIQIERFIKN